MSKAYAKILTMGYDSQFLDNNFSSSDNKRKFQFFFTGYDNDMLFNGVEVELYMKMTYYQCKQVLIKCIHEKIDSVGLTQYYKLDIYLSGGNLFRDRTLDDFYSRNDLNRKYNIYGIYHRHINLLKLDEICLEPCNIEDKQCKLIISPICDSTIRGMSDMACLLGYLINNNTNSDVLFRALSSVIHFPPFVTSLYKLVDSKILTYNDISTITSTLFTYFRSILPSKCPDDHVFEYCLPICNLIVNKVDFSDENPIKIIEKIKPKRKRKEPNKNPSPPTYMYKGDINENVHISEFNVSFDEILDSYKCRSFITPITPLSIPNQFDCAIVRGKEQEFLYMMKTPLKTYNERGCFDILDPMTGYIESKNIELFAKSQIIEDDDFDDDLIDNDKVEQIIMYDIAESGSMRNNRMDISPFIYVYQYVMIFSYKLNDFCIPCFQGLVSFNSKMTVRCPFTPFASGIDQCFKDISPNGRAKLWDSLDFCCDEISKFRKDINGNEIYRNATSRIIIFSNGKDSDSRRKVEDVVKNLLMNKIVVDAIILNGKNEQLAAVCHLTGGVVFSLDDCSKAMSLFEEIKFVDYKERVKPIEPLIPGDKTSIPFHIKPEQITEQFMNILVKNSKYDTDVISKEIQHETVNEPLITPRCFLSKIYNKSLNLTNRRIKRIMNELHLAVNINDSKSPLYDPDMKIFAYKSNVDQWRVFIKSDEDSFYGEKWWCLHVSFPELYPEQPPTFRFVSVPHHINVSKDGRICNGIIEDRYVTSKNVFEILQELKETFLLADSDFIFSLDLYFIYKNDPKEYERLAKESAEKNAKDDYNEYFTIEPENDIPDDFHFDRDRIHPAYMKSQITGKVLDREQMVVSSSGVLYDKNELSRYISSRKSPCCIVTGKNLKEVINEKHDDGFNCDDNFDFYFMDDFTINDFNDTDDFGFSENI